MTGCDGRCGVVGYFEVCGAEAVVSFEFMAFGHLGREVTCDDAVLTSAVSLNCLLASRR